MNQPDVIAEMVRPPKTLAVVGLSDDPRKPSHYVSQYMQLHGFRILPVNPGLGQVLGEVCYPSLASLPVLPDVVNVFRLPRFIPSIVDEMIELGLKAIWVQAGIIHLEAAQRAEAHGIRVVMDRCIMVEHGRFRR